MQAGFRIRTNYCRHSLTCITAMSTAFTDDRLDFYLTWQPSHNVKFILCYPITRYDDYEYCRRSRLVEKLTCNRWKSYLSRRICLLVQAALQAFLIFRTGCKSMVLCILRSFHQPKAIPTPSGQDAVWASRSIWTRWQREKAPTPPGIKPR